MTQLPSSLLDMFGEFAETEYGCKQQTSEREAAMGRKRFFNSHDNTLLMTISLPETKLFSLVVIPDDKEEDVLQAWKTFVRTQANLAALNKEIDDGVKSRDL